MYYINDERIEDIFNDFSNSDEINLEEKLEKNTIYKKKKKLLNMLIIIVS